MSILIWSRHFGSFLHLLKYVSEHSIRCFEAKSDSAVSLHLHPSIIRDFHFLHREMCKDHQIKFQNKDLQIFENFDWIYKKSSPIITLSLRSLVHSSKVSAVNETHWHIWDTSNISVNKRWDSKRRIRKVARHLFSYDVGVLSL